MLIVKVIDTVLQITNTTNKTIDTNILLANVSTYFLILKFNTNTITLKSGDKVNYILTLHSGLNEFTYNLHMTGFSYYLSYNDKCANDDYPIIYYIYYAGNINTNKLALTHVKVSMTIFNSYLSISNKNSHIAAKNLLLTYTYKNNSETEFINILPANTTIFRKLNPAISLNISLTADNILKVDDIIFQ